MTFLNSTVRFFLRLFEKKTILVADSSNDLRYNGIQVWNSESFPVRSHIKGRYPCDELP